MRQLVGDQRDQRLVADDHGGGDEAQARVLHAAVRERGRQDQQVVAAPLVRAVQLLGDLDHLLGVGELLHRGLDHARLGPDAGALADRLKHEVAGGDRQQVGRDRLRHLEAVVAVALRLWIVVRAHQHHHVIRAGDVRGVGEAHLRGVLQRHPGAGVDLLRLAEHEGLLAAIGHRRSQPLQARGLRRRRVVHADARVAVRGLDGQLAAQARVGLGQAVLQVLPLAVAALADHLVDGEVAGVEDQFAGAFVAPIQGVGRAAGEGPGVEVHRQLQCQVLDADPGRLGVGERVVLDHGGHRVGTALGRGRGAGRGGLARAAGHRERGGQAQGHHRKSHGGSVVLIGPVSVAAR